MISREEWNKAKKTYGWSFVPGVGESMFDYVSEDLSYQEKTGIGTRRKLVLLGTSVFARATAMHAGLNAVKILYLEIIGKLNEPNLIHYGLAIGGAYIAQSVILAFFTNKGKEIPSE